MSSLSDQTICDSCNRKVPIADVVSFDFVPNDKRHLGMSESESVEVCSQCRMECSE